MEKKKIEEQAASDRELMTKKEVEQQRLTAFQKIRAALAGMLIAPGLAAKRARDLGYRMHAVVGGRRDNSKWTNGELRDIRARNGVGRPAGKANVHQSADMNRQHENWLEAKQVRENARSTLDAAAVA